jgi:integrase
MVDPYERHHQRPIADHLNDFRDHLKAKGATSRYADETFGRVKAIFDSCGFRRIREVQASKIELWLAEQRGDDLAGMSPKTCNHYLTAAKRFLNWLVADRRTDSNPLQHVSKLNAETDIRRRRRCLTTEEFDALFSATLAAEVCHGLSGRDRAMLYLFAAYTGLRASELASLTRSSLDLSEGSPAVAVEAGVSKRRKRDIVPLNTELVARLESWLKERDSEPRATVAFTGEAGRLWPGEWAACRHGAKMLRGDLELAGIEYEVDGQVFDFHALRHQFISMMAAAGVHPKTAQELARHSDINLTMNAYSHVRVKDLSAAVDSLPSLGRPTTTQAATGTDGAGEDGRNLVTRLVTRIPAIRRLSVSSLESSAGQTAGDQPDRPGEDSVSKNLEDPENSEEFKAPEEAERTGFEPVRRLPVYRISKTPENASRIVDFLRFYWRNASDAKTGSS